MPDSMATGPSYSQSLTAYTRRPTTQVRVGDLWMGSDYPIRVQSMTTVDTMDTMGSVEQSIRMIEAGCELVRITAPSVKEAQNLDHIRKELNRRGYHTPICADIHFTPNAAELAARLVEKVRINPGNYADKKRFEIIDYTEQAYQDEIQRIRDKFLPLVRICKEYGTAMRIGTNHGSLSDRIMSRYGDTPVGMVESALEFLRICEDESFTNIVISMKSSNPQVMVEAYRLLSRKLQEEKLNPYPLHLGVTEAGEGEDGRTKSAMGIGTLLEDGLGDTVRVSLTEDPEFEIPVARTLVDRYNNRSETASFIEPIEVLPIDPYSYSRRITAEVENFGGKNVPRVIADYSQIEINEHSDLQPIGHFYLPATDKWAMNDLGADYIYSGTRPVPFMLPNGLKEIIDYKTWHTLPDPSRSYPLLSKEEYLITILNGSVLQATHFIKIQLSDCEGDILNYLQEDPYAILIIETHNTHAMAELRRLFFKLAQHRIHLPVVTQWTQPTDSVDQTTLYAATDCGGLLVDGLGDGLLLKQSISADHHHQKNNIKFLNSLAFGILQAARTRMSKTEYISCPSCGRTLFDLQDTTARIRQRTDHLKGIKIGIMGCIVNGPGEMADADYGYVGMGVNKIALYRGQDVVKRSVSADRALDELIELMREDGVWKEPEAVLE